MPSLIGRGVATPLAPVVVEGAGAGALVVVGGWVVGRLVVAVVAGIPGDLEVELGKAGSPIAENVSE